MNMIIMHHIVKYQKSLQVNRLDFLLVQVHGKEIFEKVTNQKEEVTSRQVTLVMRSTENQVMMFVKIKRV